jgi:hypothetical protein
VLVVHRTVTMDAAGAADKDAGHGPEQRFAAG